MSSTLKWPMQGISSRTVFGDIIAQNLVGKRNNSKSLMGPLFIRTFALANKLGVPWQVIAGSKNQMKNMYKMLAEIIESQHLDNFLGTMPFPMFAVDVVMDRMVSEHDDHNMIEVFRGWLNDLVQYASQVGLDKRVLEDREEEVYKKAMKDLKEENVLFKNMEIDFAFEEEIRARKIMGKIRDQCLRQGFDNLENMLDPLEEETLLVELDMDTLKKMQRRIFKGFSTKLNDEERTFLVSYPRIMKRLQVVDPEKRMEAYGCVMRVVWKCVEKIGHGQAVFAGGFASWLVGSTKTFKDMDIYLIGMSAFEVGSFGRMFMEEWEAESGCDGRKLYSVIKIENKPRCTDMTLHTSKFMEREDIPEGEDFVITFEKMEIKIQIIHRAFVSVLDVISSFDIPGNKVAVLIEGSRKFKILGTKSCEYFLNTGVNIMVGPQINLWRIKKYLEKGWTFFIPKMAEIDIRRMLKAMRDNRLDVLLWPTNNSGTSFIRYKPRNPRVVKNDLLWGDRCTSIQKALLMHSEMLNAVYVALNSKINAYAFSNDPDQVERYLLKIPLFE